MLSMTRFEIKKLIKSKAVFGAVLVALVVMSGFFYMHFFESQLTGNKDTPIYGQKAIRLNQKIAEDHSGLLTDERISQIIDFRVRSANNEFKTNRFMDVFSWYVTDTFIPRKDNPKFYSINNRVSRKGIKVIPVSRLGTKIPPSELKIGNFGSWDELFKVMSGSAIVISILAIYICSAVFSADFSKNIMQLLLASKYGRTKQTISKLQAVFTISTVIFLITQLITLTIFKLYFGFSGWDTSVQLNFKWQIFSFPIKMNFLQLLLWVLIFQYLGLLFTVFVTALISSYTKHTATTLAISLLVFAFPILLKQVFKSGIIYKLLWFFPIVNNDIGQMMEELSSTGSLLFNSVTMNITAIILFFVICSMAFCRIIYVHIKTLK